MLQAQLCRLLPFLLVDPCEPHRSNSAPGSDVGSYWRKGKQEEEHVSVNKGVLWLVGTRCEVALSPWVITVGLNCDAVCGKDCKS